MLKKYFILIVIILITMSGCQQEVNLDKELSEKVKTFEENDFLFGSLDITYEEFQHATKDIISDSFNYIDQKVIYSVIGGGVENVEVKGIDLKGLSKEEFENHKLKINELMDSSLEYDKITMKISPAYDTKSDYDSQKFVYSQTIRQRDEESNPSKENNLYIVNKRYTFEKQENTWKIIKIRSHPFWYSDDLLRDDDSKEEFFSKIKFGSTEEVVEYILSFTLKEGK